ncbi:HIT family protein [Cryobacterium sp. 1639]|uniref:HIT family protein n=1 Tax=Cryobacterium inferilacus TaxID=2866629 RepID=UPI001C7304CE|nr:HIT family protein [Cryobacterium sp. 1639]MBX0301350.1 HIT family protein [Cryobacterium sp. 1639]
MSDTHLDVPVAEPCAFCAYLRGERPYTVLFRSAEVAVLVTREQRGIGHLLVLPVQHRETLLDLNQVERHSIIDWLSVAGDAIDITFQRPGISVWQNNGTEAHQAIPHFHFHIAGTLGGGGTDFGDVAEVSISETDAIAMTIRSAVGVDFPERSERL